MRAIGVTSEILSTLSSYYMLRTIINAIFIINSRFLKLTPFSAMDTFAIVAMKEMITKTALEPLEPVLQPITFKHDKYLVCFAHSFAHVYSFLCSPFFCCKIVIQNFSLSLCFLSSQYNNNVTFIYKPRKARSGRLTSTKTGSTTTPCPTTSRRSVLGRCSLMAVIPRYLLS